jgi:DNA invertase Pin-like site-specific DNA recombinase
VLTMVVLETTIQTVIATYLLTNSVQETAKELNYSYSWVYRILYGVGLINVKLKKIRESINNLTENEINQIATDYLSGKLTKEIQEVHNISSTTLYVVLSKMNIPGRKKRRGFNWSKYSKEMQIGLSAEVVYLYSKNKSIAEIARELQLPFSRVRTILKTLVNHYEG